MAVEEDRGNRVVPEKNDEEKCEIKKVAMDILQDEGKSGFAAIIASLRLTDGTSGRVQEEGTIERFAVIVASGAKPERSCKNQKSRREGPPMMLRIDKWRIEGREIWSPFVEFSFESTQCSVDAESTHHDDDGDDFD